MEGQVPGCSSAPQAFQDDLERLKTCSGIGTFHHPYCNKPCPSCAHEQGQGPSFPLEHPSCCPSSLQSPVWASKAQYGPVNPSQAVPNCIPRQGGVGSGCWKRRHLHLATHAPQITPWLRLSQMKGIKRGWSGHTPWRGNSQTPELCSSSLQSEGKRFLPAA